MIQTPARPGSLWLAAVLLLIGLVPIVIYSGNLYYAEGGDSVDGPAMLLMSVLYMLPLLMPIWLALVWGFLHEYHGGAPITLWRSPTVLGKVLSAFAVVASLFFLWLIFWRLEFWRISRLPFTLYWLLWAAFFQILRISVVAREQERKSPGYSIR